MCIAGMNLQSGGVREFITGARYDYAEHSDKI